MRRWHITDMLIAVSVIILLLTLSVMPFVFTVDVSADMFANYGEIRVKVFFISVFKASVSLESVSPLEKNIVIVSGKKRDEIHINADKNDKKSIVALFHTVPIMSYIRVAGMKFDIQIGFCDNAFTTTMTVGTLRALLCGVSSFLLSRQKTQITGSVMPCYNGNALDFKIFGIFKLSLADIINGFIAGLLSKSGVKAKRNGKKRALKSAVKT